MGRYHASGDERQFRGRASLGPRTLLTSEAQEARLRRIEHQLEDHDAASVERQMVNNILHNSAL